MTNATMFPVAAIMLRTLHQRRLPVLTCPAAEPNQARRGPDHPRPAQLSRGRTAVLTSRSNCAFCSLNALVLSSILVSVLYLTSMAARSHSAS